MSHAQELRLLAAPSAVTALSGAEASGVASHSSDGNGLHSFGGQVSPRAARSQISTAVSFEGARAAGSAALPSRSLEEESALSAAEGDVDYSHSADANHAAAGSVRPIRNGRLLRPSNSLMSTAVQPASPQLQQPVSPKLNRANSVVSHTAHTGGRQHAGRAGTPASAYAPGQGFILPSRAQQQSPGQPLAVDQVEQQTAAAAAAEQHRPGFAQLPPAWQHMPPAFSGLPVVAGQAAGQETAILHSPQHQQHLNALHVSEHRDSFEGHHRSSDNGGGRRHGNLGYGGGLGFAGYQAAETVMSASAANEVAAGHPPASAAALQPGTARLQPNMQLFQNALAALPTAVAGGLLQGLLGQTGMDSSPGPSQAVTAAPRAAGTAAAVAVGAENGAASHAAGAQDAFARQSPGEAVSGNVGMSTDLLQQLQVQMTPALLAVLQGHATSAGHGHSQQVPGLPYTPQQLQQALSLLLAGLASQAGQYGIVIPGSGGSPAVQQQLTVPAGAAGMRPPPAPVQAKSCDSSIAGVPTSKQLESTRPVAVGRAAAASSAAPSSSQPRDLSPMAATAAVHASSWGISAQAGMQQPVSQQVPHGSAVGQQLQSMWLQQQRWRSPSPSPAPIALAAARTSAAGEGHGSLGVCGLGTGYMQAQQGVDAAAGAVSSAGGASRAGRGLTSEEGEADAADAAADDADQQGSIDGAREAEDGSQLAGDVIQRGATSPSRRQLQGGATSPSLRQLQHAHAAAAEQQQQHARELVNPATSVHATMMSDGNESGGESEADSGQSNAQSGGISRGAIAGEQHPGLVAEVVSQPCGASHSASPQPSASMPAVAIATGPANGRVLVGSGCSRDVAAVPPSAGPLGHRVAAVEQQHRSQQLSAGRQHGNQHEGGAEQGRQQHRDSSLAMATAGPAGTHSVTVSTNSGTVDMSIHNNSQRIGGAGSQGEAPAVGGWVADDEMQDAGNSRDGEARGEPPGTYETAESGREADNEHQAHHQHAQQQQQPIHLHEQRQQHMFASPVPAHSAAGQGAAAAAPCDGHADAAGVAHALESEQQRRREQRQGVRFASASTPGDGCVGSPSMQGAYSSSDVGIPGVSAAGYTGAVPHRQSSAAGNMSADEAVAAMCGSDHGISVADEIDAGSVLLPGAAEGLQDNLPGSAVLDGIRSGTDRQAQPATAEHVEHVPLHAAFSVTSQLQPVGQPAAAAVPQHSPQLGNQHRHRQQQRGGFTDGCNMPVALHAQVSEHGLAPPVADAVPQVTEIHGQFPSHSVPATAAAAQMAAAAAGHAQLQPDAHPQVTEMLGMFGASAGTAAGALLAAAAANGHLQNHAYSPGAAAAAAGLGATGSTLGDGGLPPLPHLHGIRVNHTYQQRPQFAAPGSSRTGPAASNGQIAAQGVNLASPSPSAYQYGGQWGGNLQIHGPRTATVDAPHFATHSRVRHSPPAVNFNPTAQGTGMVNDTSQIMPVAVAPAMLTAEGSVTPVAFDGTTAGSQLHLQEQQPCPASPSHAQGNSQLGQQDGSRGSPPAGMGRVGSVPPQDHNGATGDGGEAGVVEQEAHRSQHSLSEDAGSHRQAADDLNQRQQHVEQEADGPSHAAGPSRQQGDSRSAVTSPAQQQSRHINGFIGAAAAAAAHGDQCQQSWHRQPQQHWQQQQGAGTEGAGQVGGRAASMPFSLGQLDGSVAAGISSKIYGSVSAGFASGSKAEGSPSYGAGLDGCSCGNAMASGADGHADYRQQQQRQEDNEQDNQQQDNQQQAQSHSTRRRRRPRDGPAGAAAAAAAGALQEGEGSQGSRSQEVRSCKRQRASCEAASAQQPPSSMQKMEV